MALPVVIVVIIVVVIVIIVVVVVIVVVVDDDVGADALADARGGDVNINHQTKPIFSLTLIVLWGGGKMDHTI